MQEKPAVSPKDKARIAKAARQVSAYANFLRWTTNFGMNEVRQHPNDNRIILLSPMISGRFAFRIVGDVLQLGVQPFEAVWMASMPFVQAYLSDRLYLMVEGVDCMDAKLPPVTLGIFVDLSSKLQAMQAANHIELVAMVVDDGEGYGSDHRLGQDLIPVAVKDVVHEARLRRSRNKIDKDHSRFF